MCGEEEEEKSNWAGILMPVNCADCMAMSRNILGGPAVEPRRKKIKIKKLDDFVPLSKVHSRRWPSKKSRDFLGPFYAIRPALAVSTFFSLHYQENYPWFFFDPCFKQEREKSVWPSLFAI